MVSRCSRPLDPLVHTVFATLRTLGLFLVDAAPVHHVVDLRDPGARLAEVTRPVTDWVDLAGLATGLLTLFVRHTSASLLIQENADPDVRGDVERFFGRLVLDGDALFVHRDEGQDDMPAHVRAALTAVQLSVPLVGGRLILGTWQGVYLWEHRIRPHRREVVLHLVGE